MDIAIIGAGQIGGTLVRRLTQLGHTVRVANSRDPETLAELAAETGATAVWAADAAKDADLVIVSIPQKNTPALGAEAVAGRKPGAPVIETNNYYPKERDGRIDAIEDGLPESLWVSQLLDAPVFKVFNGIWWKHLLESGKPAGAEGRIALPIAGAHDEGRELVSRIVDDLGFDPVDSGELEESWRQQPGQPVYGKDYGIEDTLKALAEASPTRPEAFTA